MADVYLYPYTIIRSQTPAGEPACTLVRAARAGRGRLLTVREDDRVGRRLLERLRDRLNQHYRNRNRHERPAVASAALPHQTP